MIGDTNFGMENTLERNKKVLWGKYRGLVTRTDDPLHQGRIKAQIPKLFGDYDCNWAMPCSPFAGDHHGLQTLPEPGDGVWIEFEEGDPDKPIWVGYWWSSNTLPSERIDGKYTNKRRLLSCPGGIYIEFNSENNTIRITSPSHVTIDSPKVTIASDGPAIARIGDTVICPAGVGTIVTGSEKAVCG